MIGKTPSCLVRSPPINRNALSLITAPPAPNPYCCRLYFGLPDGNPATHHLHPRLNLSRIQIVPPVDRQPVADLAIELALQAHRTRIDPFQLEIRRDRRPQRHRDPALGGQHVPALCPHHVNARRHWLGNVRPLLPRPRPPPRVASPSTVHKPRPLPPAS